MPLLEVSRHIGQTAQQLTAFSAMGALPWSEEAQQQRRKLLAELCQQRAFCRAMLRRWRRSLAVAAAAAQIAIRASALHGVLDPEFNTLELR